MPTQTHLITFAEAADYISAFLNKPSGKLFTNDFGIGSLFPLPAIPNQPSTSPTTGTIFFPCCNPGQSNELVFGYAAGVTLSNSDDYSSYNPTNFNTIDTSAVTLQYPDAGTSASDVSNYLSKLDLATYLVGGLFPMPNNVVVNNQNFRKFFVSDVDSVSYGAGFFEDPAVYDMWTQDGAVTFCAFLGFDDSLTYDKVRIILIGVDSNGKLILTSNGQNVAVLLDKSWPRK